MLTLATSITRLLSARNGDHRPNLRGEQVRAQETFNRQIRGYGNNNAGNNGFPGNFSH